MAIDSNNIAKVIVKNKEKNILILTRSDNGKKDLPGGHAHINESFMMAAIRETYEETKMILTSCKEILSYANKRIFISESYELPSKEIVLDTEENISFEWVSVSEIYNIHQSNATDSLVAAKAFLMDEQRKASIYTSPLWDK